MVDLIQMLIPLLGMAASIGLLVFIVVKILSDDGKTRYKGE